MDHFTGGIPHRHQIGLASLIGIAGFIVQFQTMIGVEMGTIRLGFWIALAIFIWIGFVLVRYHEAFTSMLIGTGEEITPAERLFARAYPWICLVLTVLTWLSVEVIASMDMYSLIANGEHYLTLALLFMAPPLDAMVRGLVHHLVPPMEGEGRVAEDAYHSTKRSYIRVGRVIVFAIVVVLIARIWELDFTDMASAGFGAQFAVKIIDFLMIMAAGYIAWEVVTWGLNRKLAAEQTASGLDPGSAGGEGGGQDGSRLSTVLPMIRFTPLLAGAGIVGIAIGFGAQTLVRDVVSGIFFLIDDAFRVGEYLDIEGTVGTVEKISIRSLQLRHHMGPVHTIPYGEIPKVTNNSRDWVIVKLRFTVPFDTDVNKIKKLFKVIGAEMKEAPYAGDLIQTFKSQGVYDVDDVGIVIRGKFMAKPGTQWIIREDVYARVQKCFEENGIEFARKEVKVNIPGLDGQTDITSEQKQAISAAASEAAETVPADAKTR